MQRSAEQLSDARFARMWTAIGARGEGRDTLARLRAAYDEPHRAYHTAAHIDACLRLAEERTVRALAEHPAEVEAALWFHDAVYDTHASDNEERSARWAEQALGAAGVAPEVVARVASHVRATKDHEPDSQDGELVVDIDLSILGEAPAVFARFEEEIRREYAWVDAPLYAAGRARVLARFRDRPFIYRTPLFRERYEAQARANLDASIALLTPGTARSG